MIEEVMATPLYEPHHLLRAAEVAAILRVRTKRVYELNIPQIPLSTRCIRWRFGDVVLWIEQRRQPQTQLRRMK